jgi:DNA-binding NarL/FixJ family response regulator
MKHIASDVGGIVPGESVLPPAVVSPRFATELVPSGEPLRIVFAEDDPATALAVTAELARAFPGSHVEQVESPERFQEALRERVPDVVLVDDALEWLDVRGALTVVQETHPAAPLIVVAREVREESVVGGLRAGAEDFVSVGHLDRLRLALETALSVRSPLRKLSPRQLDVLRLIAAGHTTPGIATRLERSPKTIETHRSEIMRRLGIHDVVGLVRYAIRVGLLPPEAQTP